MTGSRASRSSSGVDDVAGAARSSNCTSRWKVEFDNNSAFVTGPKSEARRRIAACGDTAPIWVRRREAWATSPAVASRVLDQIEGKQPVAIENVDQTELTFTETVPANSDLTPDGLW